MAVSRPLIGVTSYLEPARWADWVLEAVISPAGYARAIARAGGWPVLVPPVAQAEAADLMPSLDGLVLSGGGDLAPNLYGAVPQEHTVAVDEVRDRFELTLARAACADGLPFLGIGRGVQVLNVARGGTLIQHLPDAVGHDGHAKDPVRCTAHDVTIRSGSTIGELLGSRTAVPSQHHQAIHAIGDGLLAVAWAEDDVVEALEVQGHRFGLGVQWHPEAGEDVRLFEALVSAARR